MAYAFQNGIVTLHSFADNDPQDPAIRALIGTMTITEDPGFTQRFSGEYNFHMEVATTTGQRFEASVAHPRGHWRNPLSDSEVEEKFRRLAVDTMPADQMDRVAGIILVD